MAAAGLIFRPKALTIACTDPARSMHFYGTVLGATPDSEEAYGCPWHRLGAWRITLLPNAELPSPAVFPDHAMPILWLEVADLEAAAAHFARHGVTIIDPGDGQMMMVADPDGLIIEVWQADPEVAGIVA